MKKALFIISLLSLTACTSADMLRTPGASPEKSKYAPQNESSNNSVGVVRYLNEGASFVVDARREDAYKQMFNSCNGKYEIIAETDSESLPTTFINQTSTGYMAQTVSSTYRFIHFRCS